MCHLVPHLPINKFKHWKCPENRHIRWLYWLFLSIKNLFLQRKPKLWSLDIPKPYFSSSSKVWRILLFWPNIAILTSSDCSKWLTLTKELDWNFGHKRASIPHCAISSKVNFWFYRWQEMLTEFETAIRDVVLKVFRASLHCSLWCRRFSNFWTDVKIANSLLLPKS